ncbi:hypothetical protein RhiJN_02611 [Ceratobasidium sp. AG-Ba]|nr:hypothetical protein RhiJN_02611 [Ceratobasidium sp. AG-Ba]
MSAGRLALPLLEFEPLALQAPKTPPPTPARVGDGAVPHPQTPDTAPAAHVCDLNAASCTRSKYDQFDHLPSWPRRLSVRPQCTPIPPSSAARPLPTDRSGSTTAPVRPFAGASAARHDLRLLDHRPPSDRAVQPSPFRPFAGASAARHDLRLLDHCPPSDRAVQPSPSPPFAGASTAQHPPRPPSCRLPTGGVVQPSQFNRSLAWPPNTVSDYHRCPPSDRAVRPSPFRPFAGASAAQRHPRPPGCRPPIDGLARPDSVRPFAGATAAQHGPRLPGRCSLTGGVVRPSPFRPFAGASAAQRHPRPPGCRPPIGGFAQPESSRPFAGASAARVRLRTIRLLRTERRVVRPNQRPQLNHHEQPIFSLNHVMAYYPEDHIELDWGEDDFTTQDQEEQNITISQAPPSMPPSAPLDNTPATNTVPLPAIPEDETTPDLILTDPTTQSQIADDAIPTNQQISTLESILTARFPNLQQRDSMILKAQEHCLGYAVIAFAGPFQFLNVIRYQRFNDRPLNMNNVQLMSNMYENKVKRDWRYPMIFQVKRNDISPELLAHMSQVNPNKANSPEPMMMQLRPHAEIVDLLWEMAFKVTKNGQELSDSEVEMRQAQFHQWKANAPEVTMVQGAHRSAAFEPSSQHVAQRCNALVQYRRQGNQEKANELMEEITEEIRNLTFLAAFYPDDMPKELVQLLSENEKPPVQSGASFGEECSQIYNISTLYSGYSSDQRWNYSNSHRVRDVMKQPERFPFLSPAAKKIVENAMALQMVCMRKVPIIPWTEQVEDVASSITGSGGGMCLAQMWLSMELLYELLGRTRFNKKRLGLLVTHVTQEGPSKCHSLAQDLWQNSGTRAPHLVDQSSILYTPSLEEQYQKLWTNYMAPKLYDNNWAGAPIQWDADAIVELSRKIYWRLGRWLCQQPPEWHDFGHALMVYSLRPVSVDGDVSQGFCPRAHLPSHTIIKMISAHYKWAKNRLALNVLGLSTMPAYMIWKHHPNSVPDKATSASMDVTYFVIYQQLLQRPDSWSISQALNSAIGILNHNALYQFSTATVEEHLGNPLPGSSSFWGHLDQSALDGLGLTANLVSRVARKKGWAFSNLACFSGCAQDSSQLEDKLDHGRKWIQKWLKGIELSGKTQKEMLALKAPDLSSLMKPYWDAVDLKHLLKHYKGDLAPKKTTDTALYIALYTQFWLDNILTPLAQHSDKAHQLMALSETILGQQAWWQIDPVYALRFAPLVPPLQPLEQDEQANSQVVDQASPPEVVDNPAPEVSPAPPPPNLPEFCDEGNQSALPTKIHIPAMPNNPLPSLPLQENPHITSNLLGTEASSSALQVDSAPQHKSSQSASGTKSQINDMRDLINPSPRDVTVQIHSIGLFTESYQPVPQPHHTTSPVNSDIVDTDLSDNEDVPSQREKGKQKEQAVEATAPRWAQDPLPDRPAKTIKEILAQSRSGNAPTLDVLPNTLQNLYAMRLAGRDQHKNLGAKDATVEEISCAAQETCLFLEEILKYQKLDLQCLVESCRLRMKSGVSGLLVGLGATASMILVQHKLNLTSAMMRCMSNVSEDAAMNEVARYMTANGMYSQALVEWNFQGDGAVRVNLEPWVCKGMWDSHCLEKFLPIAFVKLRREDHATMSTAYRLRTVFGTGANQDAAAMVVKDSLNGKIPTQGLFGESLPFVTTYPTNEQGEVNKVGRTLQRVNRFQSQWYEGPETSALSSGDWGIKPELPRRIGIDSAHDRLKEEVSQAHHKVQEAWTVATEKRLRDMKDLMEKSSDQATEGVEIGEEGEEMGSASLKRGRDEEEQATKQQRIDMGEHGSEQGKE